MNSLKHLFLALLLCTLTATAEMVLKGSCDSPNMTYSPGQKAVFTLRLFDQDKPVKPTLIKYTFYSDFGWKQEGEIKPKDNKPFTLAAVLNAPGLLRLRATACDDKGKALRREVKGWGDKWSVTFDGGAIFGMKNIAQDGKEPADFDSFWQAQVKRLAAVPFKVLEKKELPAPHSDKNIVVYDVKLACVGTKPVSGLLAMPRNAKPKSLKAIAVFHGYGIRSARLDKKLAADNIVFDVNAHGIENLKPKEFYENMWKKDLKAYGQDPKENATPQGSYFCNMVLRGVRAIDFLKTLPQWDGKRMMTQGHSQGGFQAIAVAALHPAVNEVFGDMPWLANTEGIQQGRLKGWYPQWTPAFRYFDTINFARRLRGTLKLNTGLGDYTCTPHSVICIFNHSNVPVTLTVWQDVSHNNNHQDSIQNASFKR